MSAEDAIHELYVAGRRAWPQLELPFEPFAAHCRRVIGAEGGASAQAHAADLFLAYACSLKHPEAMRLLERDAFDLVRAAIARINRDPEFVRETIQEVWDKLLAGTGGRIGDYGARGPLRAWVRISAVRTALDSCRKRRVQNQRRVELDEALAGDPMSAESYVIRQRYAEPLQRALRLAISSLPSRDRNVLRMHVQGSCSIDEIAKAYGCHRATAARWLDTARRRIFDLVQEEITQANPALSAGDLRAIVGTLGSALVLSLSATATHGEPIPVPGAVPDPDPSADPGER